MPNTLAHVRAQGLATQGGLRGPVEADAHSLKALHAFAERVGHRVALDQARYVNTPDGPRLELYKGRV